MMINTYDNPDRWTPSQRNCYDNGYVDAFRGVYYPIKNDIHGIPYKMGHDQGKIDKSIQDTNREVHSGWFK